MNRCLLLVSCVLPWIGLSDSQLISPCPRLFTYEQNDEENDRWYGTVTLRSDSDLSGIWLRLVLDKSVLQLGNWFGEVTTKDNTDFLLKSPTHKLPSNTPLKVRFYVKYEPGEPPPRLVEFRLNAKTVCPEKDAPTTGAPFVSEEFTSNPVPSEQQNSVVPTVNRNNIQGCGIVTRKAVPLITHGQETTHGQWPWHVALYRLENEELTSTYICGGTLISERHVLTAAHCVSKRHGNHLVDPNTITLYFGKYRLKAFGAPVQQREVSRIHVHPQFDSSTYFNDVAVLKLKEDVEIGDYVRPCCLWEGSNEVHNIVNKLGTVIGWGFDETGKVSSSLMQARMPVVSFSTCLYSNRDFFSQFTSDKSFCAGFRNGTSVCNGDSGGGMVFERPGTNGRNSVWQIRGLVSVGVALQGGAVCDPSHYVIFTDVAKHLDWIKQVMS